MSMRKNEQAQKKANPFEVGPWLTYSIVSLHALLSAIPAPTRHTSKTRHSIAAPSFLGLAIALLGQALGLLNFPPAHKVPARANQGIKLALVVDALPSRGLRLRSGTEFRGKPLLGLVFPARVIVRVIIGDSGKPIGRSLARVSRAAQKEGGQLFHDTSGAGGERRTFLANETGKRENCRFPVNLALGELVERIGKPELRRNAFAHCFRQFGQVKPVSVLCDCRGCVFVRETRCHIRGKGIVANRANVRPNAHDRARLVKRVKQIEQTAKLAPSGREFPTVASGQLKGNKHPSTVPKGTDGNRNGAGECRAKLFRNGDEFSVENRFVGLRIVRFADNQAGLVVGGEDGKTRFHVVAFRDEFGRNTVPRGKPITGKGEFRRNFGETVPRHRGALLLVVLENVV